MYANAVNTCNQSQVLMTASLLIPSATGFMDDSCPIGDDTVVPLQTCVPYDGDNRSWINPDEKLRILVRFMKDGDGYYLKILRAMVRSKHSRRISLL